MQVESSMAINDGNKFVNNNHCYLLVSEAMQFACKLHATAIFILTVQYNCELDVKIVPEAVFEHAS